MLSDWIGIITACNSFPLARHWLIQVIVKSKNWDVLWKIGTSCVWICMYEWSYFLLPRKNDTMEIRKGKQLASYPSPLILLQLKVKCWLHLGYQFLTRSDPIWYDPKINGSNIDLIFLTWIRSGRVRVNPINYIFVSNVVI
jgi:hypothetical protein